MRQHGISGGQSGRRAEEPVGPEQQELAAGVHCNQRERLPDEVDELLRRAAGSTMT